jgi:ABC-type sugar transport system ATPase subunit
MNMVDGKVVKDAGRVYAEGGGIRALIENDLDEGREVTIGIRPHDLVLAKNGSDTVAELKVELVEMLGFEAFAHGWLRQSGPTVIARIEPEDARSVKAGCTVALAAQPSRVHLFDPKTGVSCAAR